MDRLAFIGFGTNLGDRRGHLDRAAAALRERGVRLTLRSSIYRTEPVEVTDQPEFLNLVAACPWDASLEDLLAACLATEREMGRVRDRDKGPRIIDLDLLLCGDEVRRGEGLIIPHPRLHLRRFVLVPLAEIAPDARHPLLHRTVAEMLADCPDRSRVERLGGES